MLELLSVKRFINIIFLLLLLLTFFISGCMSETGLVFLKEDRSAFSVSLVLLEDSSIDHPGYQYGLSEKDLNVSFNDILLYTRTDENGFFSIDFPAVNLIKIYTEDPTIKKIVDSKMSLEELFVQDSSETVLEKYVICLKIFPVYDDTVELYFPPQIVEHTAKIDNSRLIIKKESDKYFYKLIDENNQIIFGSPYGNGFFRAYSFCDKENEKNEFSMNRQLMIMEKQLKNESHIDNITQIEISLDTVEVLLTGFNFYKDTGSVFSHQGVKNRITSWSTGEVSFITNNLSKEFFLNNSKGKSVFFSLNNDFLLNDTQETQILIDTFETELNYDTYESYFYKDTLEIDSFFDTLELEVLTEDTDEQDIIQGTEEIEYSFIYDTYESRIDSKENMLDFNEFDDNMESTKEVKYDIGEELFIYDTDTLELTVVEEVKKDTIEISFYLTDTKEISFYIFEDSDETDILKYTYSDTAEIEWNDFLLNYNIQLNKNKIIETNDKLDNIEIFTGLNLYLVIKEKESYLLFINPKENLEKKKIKQTLTTDNTD